MKVQALCSDPNTGLAWKGVLPDDAKLWRRPIGGITSGEDLVIRGKDDAAKYHQPTTATLIQIDEGQLTIFFPNHEGTEEIAVTLVPDDDASRKAGFSKGRMVFLDFRVDSPPTPVEAHFNTPGHRSEPGPNGVKMRRWELLNPEALPLQSVVFPD